MGTVLLRIRKSETWVAVGPGGSRSAGGKVTANPCVRRSSDPTPEGRPRERGHQGGFSLLLVVFAFALAFPFVLSLRRHLGFSNGPAVAVGSPGPPGPAPSLRKPARRASNVPPGLLPAHGERMRRYVAPDAAAWSLRGRGAEGGAEVAPRAAGGRAGAALAVSV